MLTSRNGARRGGGGKFAALALALALAACLKATPPASAATAPLARSPDGRPLVVTFSDDFDSFRPWRGGHGVWRTTFRDGAHADEDEDGVEIRTLKGNKEAQLYVDPDFGRLGLNPFQVHDGVLEIRAEPAPERARHALKGYRYTSGLITTQPSFSQTYGYFEMRAALPSGKGLWPAFWLLPQDLSWPPEIDVMESIGNPSKYYVTLHSKPETDSGTEIAIDSEGFHTFAISWDARFVVWYLDGREVKRRPTPPDMNKPMYLLANLALGGGWAGDPDESTPFPASFKIDYIRAYRFAQ